MILAIDVGNTNVVLGCVEDGRVKSVVRLATNRYDLASDYAIKIRQCFEFEDIDYRCFEGAILASVVPEVNEAIKAAVKKLTGLDCMTVSAGLKTGMNIKIDDPGELAADLLTGAVGAVTIAKPPLLVVDLGTANTVFAVDKDGAFIGGAIIPGVNISYSALVSGTSLLPNIAINAPKKCISTNTVDCMKSGAVYGTAAMIDGVIERMEEEMGESVTVVATGGIARHIIPYCKRKMIHDPDLILKGLSAIYDKNKKKKR